MEHAKLLAVVFIVGGRGVYTGRLSMEVIHMEFQGGNSA